MIERLRLISGLVMFVFVIGHLSNHALGLISLEAMNAGLAYLSAPWKSLPGRILLLGAALLHIGLALWSLYGRRTLKMTRRELGILLLGFLIPTILISHVIATDLMPRHFGITGDYNTELAALWVWQPFFGVLQATLLIMVWVHSCLGLANRFRLKPWYARWRGLLTGVAVIFPTVALAGYVAGGARIWARFQRQDLETWLLANYKVGFEVFDWVVDVSNIAVPVFIFLVLAVLGLRWFRNWRQKARALTVLKYQGARPERFEIPAGATVLEILRANDIPHASVCGGKGRCSTCRVHISQGQEALEPAAPEEERVLRRISAPPTVRLACQLRPTANLEVTPLLPATVTASDLSDVLGRSQGRETRIAILFADLRDFTTIAESKLPYDVVFILNQYFSEMGQAIEAAGGRVDKFIGDGVMALFGLDGRKDGAVQGLRAARGMLENLERLNARLQHDLETPLRIGIGLHVGAAIVGSMGYGETMHLTAIGDPVNVASRLEELTKTFDAPLVISEELARDAGLAIDGLERHEVDIRGRQEPLSVFALAGGDTLPS